MKRIRKRIVWKKRLFSAALALSMTFTLLSSDLLSTEAEAAVTLANPETVEDSEGQSVTWDCVWFGSYPQLEVVSEEIGNNYTSIYKGDKGYNGYFKAEEDILVSDDIYSALQEASEWDENNDILLDGVKYHRMKEADATYSNTGSAVSMNDYYIWEDSTSYHYFKYSPIKWRVLSVSGNQALLLADMVLDSQRYNLTNTGVTWETSTIRSWLNGYDSSANNAGKDYRGENFIDRTFTDAEQSAIAASDLANNNNPTYDTEGGNHTTDKIFLLSESDVYNTEQALSYGFCLNGHRYCKGSTYAMAMGLATSSTYFYMGNCCWWLRSPGQESNYAAYIINSGITETKGKTVQKNATGVRPALNLKLSCLSQYCYAGTMCWDGTAKKMTTEEIGYEIANAQAKIDALDVSNITLNSESAINEAKAAYEKLTDEQKEGIIGYEKVVAAEKKLNELRQAEAKRNSASQVASKASQVSQAVQIPQALPYVKLNVSKAPLQVRKSTKAIKVTSIGKGDKVASWKSSDKKVATVTSKGMIKARKIGKAKITVTTKKGAKATCTITVQKAKVKTKSLKVSTGARLTLKKGKKKTIIVTRNPITATEKISYQSSNKKIATVTKKGIVRAKKKGSCRITVKSSNGKRKVIKVKVK